MRHNSLKVCNLDLTFKGNQRSKITRSTERSYMTLYMCFIQTLVTACTTLVNLLSFHHLTSCPLPFFALTVSKQLIFLFFILLHFFKYSSFYMTLEYIKNYSENIMLSHMMCYCIKVMFLLFLFGASRKTACRGYTCPSKFPLINIVNL